MLEAHFQGFITRFESLFFINQNRNNDINCQLDGGSLVLSRLISSQTRLELFSKLTCFVWCCYENDVRKNIKVSIPFEIIFCLVFYQNKIYHINHIAEYPSFRNIIKFHFYRPFLFSMIKGENINSKCLFS